MANDNEVLTDLHAVRETLLKESGGTLSGLSKRLREEQAKSDRTIVSNVQDGSTLSDASGAESA